MLRAEMALWNISDWRKTMPADGDPSSQGAGPWPAHPSHAGFGALTSLAPELCAHGARGLPGVQNSLQS